jgi:hypothetical protein
MRELSIVSGQIEFHPIGSHSNLYHITSAAKTDFTPIAISLVGIA